MTLVFKKKKLHPRPTADPYSGGHKYWVGGPVSVKKKFESQQFYAWTLQTIKFDDYIPNLSMLRPMVSS